MAKQPKEFEKHSYLGNPLLSSKEWSKSWNKIKKENKELLVRYMKDTNIASQSWFDMTLFNKEGVADVFSQTMQTLREQAEDPKKVYSSPIENIQDYWRSVLNELHRKSIKRIKSRQKHSQLKEHHDNPFFNLLHQSYLLNEQFLKDSLSRIGELDPQISHKLTKYTRNLVHGLSLSPNHLSDVGELQGALEFTLSMLKADPTLLNQPQIDVHENIDGFKYKNNIGVTSGKIIFQNDLFQLIQYEPSTSSVAKQPLLIVPPWINKYYIFDLNHQNSFVRWAINSGLTVYVISWANSQETHYDATLTDYVLEGVKCALDEVCHITSVKKVNVIGYCLGGVLIACLLGYLKAKRDNRIASASFLATPFDFSKVDNLGLYRHEHQKQRLKSYSPIQGGLENQYIVQIFNLLRVNDLIWSYDVNHYLLGQDKFPYDMLYWACDPITIPTKLHQTFLQDILFDNQLMKSGQLLIDDVPVKLQNLKTPLFIMGAKEDHLAPLMSVYALTHSSTSDSRKFLLSSSGHLKGVFNPPELHRSSYWEADSLPEDANEWLKIAKEHKGSWWHEWRKWLEAYEGGQVPARSILQDRVIEDAPGRNVKLGK